MNIKGCGEKPQPFLYLGIDNTKLMCYNSSGEKVQRLLAEMLLGASAPKWRAPKAKLW